jgi:hypothetical protein
MSRVRKLASLQPFQKRQYYASKIRKLDIHLLSITSAFDNLVFSSLEALWLYDYGSSTKVYLVPYLQSRIRTLSFRGRELDPRSLNLVRSYCPLLTELSIRGPLGNVDDTAFASFIQCLSYLRKLFLSHAFDVSAATVMFKTNTEILAPKLEVLGLMDLMDFPDPRPFRMFMKNCKSLKSLVIFNRGISRPFMTGSLLSHVMNANPLQHMHADWLTTGLLEQIPMVSRSVQPFGALKALKIHGCSMSVLSVLDKASSRLQALELCLYDIDTELFNSIGKQKQLRYLAIAPFTHDEVLSMKHLSALSSLTSLEFFEITYHRVYAMSSIIHGLNDSTFSQLISDFSKLGILFLNSDRPGLGFAAIRSLSQACPLLKRCALLYDHDLSTWIPTETNSSPLFPNLVSLYLGRVADFAWGGWFDSEHAFATLVPPTGGVSTFAERRARVCAYMLLNCFPSLKRFGVRNITLFARTLQTELVQIRPCKRLRAGDVAETPITTVQGAFSFTDFMGPL